LALTMCSRARVLACPGRFLGTESRTAVTVRVTEEGTPTREHFRPPISSHTDKAFYCTSSSRSLQNFQLATLHNTRPRSTSLTLVTMTPETDSSNPKAPELADRPSSMAAAAFLGIAWFICIELNIRLLYRATRRSLYFWSCLLCSWGLVVHGISIILANFNKWTSYSAIVFIYLSWLVFVVAQSFVLYSRLGLVWRNTKKDRYILYMITTNSVIFGLTTVLFGMIAARLSLQAAVPY